MIELGQIIKAKRLSSSLSIEDVKSRLCIRAEYLIAIEDGNKKAFLSEAYYYGFLKQYLQLLQLDEIAIESKPIITAPRISTIGSKIDSLSFNYLILLIVLVVISLIYAIGTNFIDFNTIDPISYEINKHNSLLVQQETELTQH